MRIKASKAFAQESRNECEPKTGSAGALARIEREQIPAPFFLILALLPTRVCGRARPRSQFQVAPFNFGLSFWAKLRTGIFLT
jgi:hypothetical protein